VEGNEETKKSVVKKFTLSASSCKEIHGSLGWEPPSELGGPDLTNSGAPLAGGHLRPTRRPAIHLPPTISTGPRSSRQHLGDTELYATAVLVSRALI